MKTPLTLVAALLLVPLAALHASDTEKAAESPRRTPIVKLAVESEPAIVAIYTEREGILSSGSGTVINPHGFILTNDHVVRNYRGQVLFQDGAVRPFHVVGRSPEKDLAIILVSAKEPLKVLPLGRSHDVMTGEPVLVAGNPGGRGIVFSSGIVSSPRIMVDAPNALWMQKFPNDTRDRFIQFDAASNPGNSGGPLINAEGAQIAVVSASNKAEQNINFAIPIDRMREWSARMLAPEVKGDFFFGIECDAFANHAVVTSVAKDSPAARAGIMPGDTLIRAGDEELRHGLDWSLALVGLGAGANLPVEWERKGVKTSVTLTADAYPLLAAMNSSDTKPGLSFSVYPLEEPARLPNFTQLKAARQGITTTLDPRSIEPRLPSFGLVLDGFIDLQSEDWFRLIIESDDGSRVLLHDRVIIDNDGRHPPRKAGVVLRAAKGLHPLRIEFFEMSGASVLKLLIETADGKVTEIGKESLRHLTPTTP
jgi:S1-C subfamily serine protease